MDQIKALCWNVEWLIDAFSVASGRTQPASNRKTITLQNATAKMIGLATVLKETKADLVCLIEAIGDPDLMQECVETFFDGYRLVRRPGVAAEYATQGVQWVWFLATPELLAETDPQLVPIATWQDYTLRVYSDQSSRKRVLKGKWWVSVPTIVGDEVGAYSLKSHQHYRHPQVLVLEWAGRRIEFIGAHLKSKHIGRNVPRRGADEKDEDYYDRSDVRLFMAKAAIARIKLSTEAVDVRNYIDQRFNQEELPAIVVMGDLNDGPGKELLEREYLFHDLIGNLQGDVFFARRFLNHALFDNPQELRWTSRFVDKLDPARDPHILLDHIAFTEGLSRRGLGQLIVHPKAGKVEHEVFERIESLLPMGVSLSDHRPVSLVISSQPPA